MTAADRSDIADEHLRVALSAAAGVMERDTRPLSSVREEDLRTALHAALDGALPGRVRKEQKLELKAFRGVGGFDLLVDRSEGGPIHCLAEVKWSYTRRSKIFEAVWDAVKLCLAAREHRAARCWLITGAPDSQWASAECRELFESGVLSFHDLWKHPLVPAGPNGGVTVGEDLLAGGRGNRFISAPSAFAITRVGREPLRPATERWSLRAVAVQAAGGWIENFASAPMFPPRINQRWLNASVPQMSDPDFDDLVMWLREKRWTDAQLMERVYPLRARGRGDAGPSDPAS